MLVRRGFYRFIRHPVYAGIYLALIAWPIAYGAPISAVLAVIIVGMVMNHLIKREEEQLIERYGEEYRQVSGRERRYDSESMVTLNFGDAESVLTMLAHSCARFQLA